MRYPPKYTIPVKENEQIAIECKIFLAIFGHFWAPKPNLYRTRFQLILPVDSQNLTKNRRDHRMHVEGPQICQINRWNNSFQNMYGMNRQQLTVWPGKSILCPKHLIFAYLLKGSVPENFKQENFSGLNPTESLCTQDSENVVGLGDRASQNIPYLFKNWENRDWMIVFLGYFW